MGIGENIEKLNLLKKMRELEKGIESLRISEQNIVLNLWDFQKRIIMLERQHASENKA